ncbi:MAG: EVE domain-containing protein [Desulfurococcaceae archaeon]
MPRYWIVVVSEENWHVVKESGVFGAPEPRRGRGARDLVEPGDVLIFYVKARNCAKLCGKFVGAFRVASTWFREEKPL